MCIQQRLSRRALRTAANRLPSCKTNRIRISRCIYDVEYATSHATTHLVTAEDRTADYLVISECCAIRFPIGHFLLVVLWNQASISNGFRNVLCDAMVDMTLNYLYAKSFWHQSIPYIRLPMGCQINSNFCSRTHHLATYVTDRRHTDATL